MLYDPFNRWPTHRPAIWTGIAFVVALVFAPRMLYAVRPPASITIDYFQEWASGRNYLGGLPIYTNHRTTLALYLGQIERDPVIIRVNAHPPTSVLLAIPFAHLEFVDARFAWNLSCLAMLAASLIMIARGLRIPSPRWAVYPWVALLLSCSPLFMHLVFGQINLVLLMLITLTWVCDRSGRPILAGVALGAAVAIKLFPGFLFLYFAATRRWRTIYAGAITVGALTAATVAVLGPDPYFTYVRDVLPRVADFRGSWVNSSLAGFWAKLFDPTTRGHAIRPLAYSPLTATVASALSAVGVVAVLLRAIRNVSDETERDHAFGLCITAMLLVSPIAFDHYFLLLPLPLATLWLRLPPTRLARGVFTVSLATLWAWMGPAYDAAIPGGLKHGVATPLHAVTILAVQCYALIALFALGAMTARRP